MNRPVMEGLRLNVPAYVRHARLIDWVAEMAALTEAQRCLLVRRQPGRVRPPVRAAGRRRHLQEAQPRAAPEQLPGAAASPSDVARVEDRTFICSERKEDAGPTNNWMAPAEMRALLQTGDARRCSAARCAAARCTSCRSRWARSARRSRTSASSCPTALRRGQHEHHDAHGPRGARRARQRRRVRAVRAHRRRAARAGPEGRRLAVQHDQVHRPLPRDAARSGATAPATAATRCSARSASRCASPRRWGATRAGSPSTC